VAVASAGPYASLHLAPDRYHASIPPLSFLQTGCPSCCPTNSVKALKADHPEKKTYSTGAELAGAQKSFIAENTTIT